MCDPIYDPISDPFFFMRASRTKTPPKIWMGNWNENWIVHFEYWIARTHDPILGSNFLMIETGRKEGMSSYERKYWFGCNATEDEKHFLLHCNMYENLREQVGNSARVEDGNATELEMMLGRCNKDQLAKVLLYIKRAAARRNRILDTREPINQN